MAESLRRAVDGTRRPAITLFQSVKSINKLGQRAVTFWGLASIARIVNATGRRLRGAIEG